MKKILIIISSLLLLCGCATSHLEDGKESVVTFDKDGISAQELYDALKAKYGAEELIRLIDTKLLDIKYKEDENEKNYVSQMVDSMKNEYGDNFSSVIKSNYNVDSEDELKDIIRLSYRRNLWLVDYSEGQVSDKQIEDYYENSLVGDIEASHILIEVKATDSMSSDEKKELENEALEKANDIINRLNDGEKFEDLAKEFSDDAANKDNGGKLDKFNDRTNFDANFLEGAIKLEVGKYTTSPVKSQYGYHIIYKASQEDKPKLKDVEESIITKVASDVRKSDTGYLAKALLGLREEFGMKVTDSDLEKKYNSLYGL